MASSMQDLDNALSQFEQAEQSAIQEIQSAVNDILAKVGPSVDTTQEIQRIQNAQQSLQQAADAVRNLDVQPSPSPTPNPTPAPSRP